MGEDGGGGGGGEVSTGRDRDPRRLDGGGRGGGGGERLYPNTQRCTVATRMTPSLRLSATRAVLMFH